MQNNLTLIQSYGNVVIPPGNGELASGLFGEGRMAEPETIVSFIAEALDNKLPLKDWKVLVNAGPTYEAIDPVRFIGNHSSGKMGFAVAEELARNGAEVLLVTGPVALTLKAGLNIKRIDVVTAAEMYDACLEHFPSCKLAILAAAVADYTPEVKSSDKIKKNEGALSLQLKATKDILLTLGQQKTKGQVLVGFALETENEIENATSKIKKKNLDLIVLNSLKDPGAGFKTDTNKVTFIDNNNQIEALPLQDKTDVARAIVAKIRRIAV
jgi:phosphopantothenoylcysteine decarboxylase/phosphopantothenate--cysteine ligase